jgi:hypothetical protein
MEHVRKTYFEGDLKKTVIGQFEGHDFGVLWLVDNNNWMLF